MFLATHTHTSLLAYNAIHKKEREKKKKILTTPTRLESIYEEGRPHRKNGTQKEQVGKSNLVWGLAFYSLHFELFLFYFVFMLRIGRFVGLPPKPKRCLDQVLRRRRNTTRGCGQIFSLTLLVTYGKLSTIPFDFLFFVPLFFFRLSCLFILLSQATRRVLYIYTLAPSACLHRLRPIDTKTTRSHKTLSLYMYIYDSGPGVHQPQTRAHLSTGGGARKLPQKCTADLLEKIRSLFKNNTNQRKKKW